jgi:PAS domain S-box-containing protein
MVVALLAVVSLLTFRLYFQGTREVLSQFQERQVTYAHHLSTQIQFFFQARSRGLRALASLVSLEKGDYRRQKLSVESYARQIDSVYVKAVSLYDARGTMVYSTHPQSTGVRDGDTRFYAWAQKTENAGKTALMPASPGQQPLVFIMATPLYEVTPEPMRPWSRGRFSGYLSFTLDMKGFLSNQLRSADTKTNLDQIWIVNKDGTLLFQPDHPDMVFRSIHQKETSCGSCHASFKYVEKMLAGRQGTVDYEIKGHARKVASFVPMEFEDVSWVIVVNAPYDRVTGFVKSSMRGHVLLLAIILLALTGGSLLIIRRERMQVRAEDEAVRWQEKTAESRKAEEALQLERNKLKGILDSMADAVYIVNEEYEMVYSNPVIEKEYGPIRGRKCYEYLRDQPKVCSWCKSKQVFAGKTVGWEWHSSKTGRTFDLIDTPFSGPNGVRCKLSIIRDITDRKRAEKELRESEERYRVLVETMNDGLGIQDEKGLWTYVNDRLAEMLGYRKEEMIGLPVTDFLSEADRNTYRQQMTGRTKGERGFYELSWLRKDLQVVPTLVSAKAILDDFGQFRGSFAVLTGITERKRAEEALRESEKQLRDLSTRLLTAQETERKRISIELHDELGQALTVLKLHLNFIEKHLSAEQAGLRHECERAIEYIEQVIEDVRRLSRDLSPTILEDFGLSAAIRWLIGNFAKRHNIRVSLDMIDIDALVARDSHTILYRIIQEALTNIGKHSQAKHVTMTVKKDTSTVSIVIEDDGKGFDAAETVTRSPEDTGLGLATMKGRAQMLGGALAVRAEAGRGTRIIVTVPLDGGGRQS